MSKQFRFLLFTLFVFSKLFPDSIQKNIPYVIIGKTIDEIINTEDSCWLYMPGDKAEYSMPDHDDSKWRVAKTKMYEGNNVTSTFKGQAWFRLHLKVDSAFGSRPLVLYLNQKGASQIFVDGKMLKEIGDYDAPGDERDNGMHDPIWFVAHPGENVIAIRYENRQYDHSFDNTTGIKQYGFEARIYSTESFWINNLMENGVSSLFGLGFFSFLFTVGLVHLLLFAFYKARRSNLHFSLFCFLFSYYFLHMYLVNCILTSLLISNVLTAVLLISVPPFFLSLLTVLYSLFYDQKPRLWKISLWVTLCCSVLLMVVPFVGFALSALFVVVTSVEIIRVLVVALRKKKRGARIIFVGFGALSLFLLFTVACVVVGNITDVPINFNWGTALGNIFFLFFFIALAGIPLCMSTFLAWDFAQTNKTLSKKLIEVEELSARAIEQEKEKQKILADQNEVLETQVEERTKEINEQKKVIEEKNKDITDSINYAQRIQRSILPTEAEIKDIFKDSFVLFKPRDIVSGDFYQFKKNGNLRYAILADCTGHGVPGALMSMIGSNLLKQIILERGVKEPNVILHELHKEVRSTLRQSSGLQSHDGMDAAIVLLEENRLYIASANRPVYIVRKGELTELKPDKRSIGGSSVGDDLYFNVNELEVEAGMMVYLFSDGYADQFGGDQGKKFKVKNLGGLLVSLSAKPLETQKEILNTTFDNWKKHLEQVDDVSLIGLKF